MTDSTSDDGPWPVAAEQLTALVSSSHAARTFVALVALGDGTARDASEVSDVPRTRVYGAADQEHGPVGITQSNPKRFRGVWMVTGRVTEFVDGEGSHSSEPLDETAILGVGGSQRARGRIAGAFHVATRRAS